MKHSLIILISLLLLSSLLTSCEKKEEKPDLSKFYELMYFEEDYLPKPDRRGVLYIGIRSGETRWYEEKWEGLETEDNKDIGKYEGDIVDGFPTGYGTLTLPDGSKYVGILRSGNMDGQGTTTFPNESRIVGEYNYGKIWNGTQYDKDGNIEQKFVNGKEIGIEIQKPNKDIYDYSTKDVDSIIKKYFPTKKSKYQGDLENGVPHGKGEFTWSDGSKEIGEYKDGNEWNTRYYDKDGNFTYKYVNGTFYNKEGTIILKSENNRLHQRPKIEKKVVNGEWIKQ